MSLAQRFDAKVERSNACWRWLGFIDKAGYARIREGGRKTPVLYAHRYAYERFIGPIPTGLTIDHLCRNRACVNPDHLEAVTNRENCLRGRAPNILLHLSGRCSRGHEQTPENTYRRPDGRLVYCKLCRTIRRQRERTRAASP